MNPRNVIICDFDGTLYDHGLVEHVANYLRAHAATHDILIVTSRKYGNGIGQVQRVLYDARIKPAAIFPGLGHDNPVLKSAVVNKVKKRAKITLAIDNNPDVVLEYKALGIKAVTPSELLTKE